MQIPDLQLGGQYPPEWHELLCPIFQSGGGGQYGPVYPVKGKIVYIDVWATWCAPCIKEFPYSRQLQKSFELNEDVVFLYVSIDKNREAWKELISADDGLKGLHINQPEGEIKDAYLIEGVPRYILVDRDGNIANPNAPKPSSGNVEQEISQLLKK